MNQHTRAAREWLDRRYSRSAEGRYRAHQPIEGLRTRCSEPNRVLRLARTYRLLQLLDRLSFDSFLDVGGGEGYMAALVRDLFAPAAAHSTDLSRQACQRGGELFGIQGVASDICRLPVKDRSYDVVLCSEVIEHLSAPVLAIGELVRVARKYVIISTAEFCPLGEVERRLRLATLDASYPHAEVNWFTPRDFRVLLGSSATLSSQFQGEEPGAGRAPLERSVVERQLEAMTASFLIDVDHVGVIALCPQPGADVPAAWTPAPAARRRRILDRLLDPPSADPEPLAPGAPLRDPALTARLRCVACDGDVGAAGPALACRACGQTFPAADGVPSMFVETPDPAAPAQALDAAVTRLAGGDARRDVAIRRLAERLHPARPRANGALRRWAATQLLRVLWLLGRDEPSEARRRRFVRRLRPGRQRTPPGLSLPAAPGSVGDESGSGG